MAGKATVEAGWRLVAGLRHVGQQRNVSGGRRRQHARNRAQRKVSLLLHGVAMKPHIGRGSCDKSRHGRRMLHPLRAGDARWLRLLYVVRKGHLVCGGHAFRRVYELVKSWGGRDTGSHEPIGGICGRIGRKRSQNELG